MIKFLPFLFPQPLGLPSPRFPFLFPTPPPPPPSRYMSASRNFVLRVTGHFSCYCGADERADAIFYVLANLVFVEKELDPCNYGEILLQFCSIKFWGGRISASRSVMDMAAANKISCYTAFIKHSQSLCITVRPVCVLGEDIPLRSPASLCPLYQRAITLVNMHKTWPSLPPPAGAVRASGGQKAASSAVAILCTLVAKWSRGEAASHRLCRRALGK